VEGILSFQLMNGFRGWQKEVAATPWQRA
jgi:hypothetical protein